MKREVAGMTEAQVERWMHEQGRKAFAAYWAKEITFEHYNSLCQDAIQNYIERVVTLVNEKVERSN